MQRGLLSALSNPYLGPALMAMHQQVQRAWSVAILAAHAHLSRAAFARRFVEAIGVTPMVYLTRLRMQLARSALAERGISVAEAAGMTGYATEASFIRAFKRTHGCSPGAPRSA